MDSLGRSCRACLQLFEENEMFPLFFYKVSIEDEYVRAETVDLAEIYNQCTQLCYNQTDSYSDWVCSYCFHKLVEFYKFRKMCIDSNQKCKEIEPMATGDGLKVEMVTVCADIPNQIEANNDNIHEQYMENDNSTRSSFAEVNSASEFTNDLNEDETNEESNNELTSVKLEKDQSFEAQYTDIADINDEVATNAYDDSSYNEDEDEDDEEESEEEKQPKVILY